MVVGIPVLHLAPVYKHYNGDLRKFFKALKGLFPMFLFTIASYGWVFSPFSTIRQRYFLLFFSAFGVAFGKAGTKIIYAHLTHMRFPNPSGSMIPLYIGCIIANLPHLFPSLTPLISKYEGAYLWIWLAFGIQNYFIWSYHVIVSFRQYLDIYFLSIKRKPSKKNN